MTDRTTTTRASMVDVQFTLALTVVLVVLVIFLFLRKLWATVIPSVALPVSLVELRQEVGGELIDDEHVSWLHWLVVAPKGLLDHEVRVQQKARTSRICEFGLRIDETRCAGVAGSFNRRDDAFCPKLVHLYNEFVSSLTKALTSERNVCAGSQNVVMECPIIVWVEWHERSSSNEKFNHSVLMVRCQ